ncbi:MAG: hypothetical protein ABSC23_11710 [Bryobacteraceae bacterium]
MLLDRQFRPAVFPCDEPEHNAARVGRGSNLHSAATAPAFYAVPLIGTVVTMQPHVQQEPLEANFRDLYPTLSGQELKEAEKNLTRYLEIAFEVYQEQIATAGAVDTPDPAPIINQERSNCSQKT